MVEYPLNLKPIIIFIFELGSVSPVPLFSMVKSIIPIKISDIFFCVLFLFRFMLYIYLFLLFFNMLIPMMIF